MVVKARQQLLERLLGRCSAGRSRCWGGAALPLDRARNAKPADGAGIAASAWVLGLDATGTQHPDLTPGVETSTAAVINRNFDNVTHDVGDRTDQSESFRRSTYARCGFDNLLLCYFALPSGGKPC